MHEMPVVMNVVELVDDYARQNDVREVRKVIMEIGEIAMVIPHYFRSFWEPVIEQSDFCKNAELQIDVVPGIGIMKSFLHIIHARDIWAESAPFSSAILFKSSVNF